MRLAEAISIQGKRVKENEEINKILNPGSTYKDLNESVKESVKKYAPRPSRNASMRKF